MVTSATIVKRSRTETGVQNLSRNLSKVVHPSQCSLMLPDQLDSYTSCHVINPKHTKKQNFLRPVYSDFVLKCCGGNKYFGAVAIPRMTRVPRLLKFLEENMSASKLR